MQRKLRLLAQRACVPGVLDSTQLGVTVHGLYQLELLVLQDAAMLQLIRDHIVTADARTQANVLHAMAMQARVEFDVKVALPDLVEATLRDVQEELSENTDQLTAPQAILAMEAVMKLLPYGGVGAHRARRVREAESPSSTDDCARGGVVDGLLLRELQDRSLALVTAVEHPTELIGIARVAMEGLQLPVLNASSVPDEDDFSEGPEEDLSTQWCESVLKPLLTALEARMDGWHSQDLMSLVDVLVLRGASVHSASAAAGAAARREHISRLSARHALVLEHTAPSSGSSTVPDLCRPFIGHILLERVAPSVAELTPSQCAAWLLRLVRLGYHREADAGPFKALFMSLVARCDDPAVCAAMSASQLSTCACTISRVLAEDGAVSTTTFSSTSPSLTGRAAEGTSLTRSFTVTDTDACLRAWLGLFSCLCTTLEAAYGRQTTGCHSPEASHAAVTQVLPVLLALPEEVLVSCVRRGTSSAENSTRVARADGAFRALQTSFPDSLRWGGTFVLRHFHSLLPREKVHIATVAFHWNLFEADHSGSMLGDETSGSGAGSDALSASTVLAALTPRRTGASSAADTASDPARRERQLVALCGLVQSALPTLNTLDCLQILNEATATAYHARGASSMTSSDNVLRDDAHGGGRTEGQIHAGMTGIAALRQLLLDLHRTLQSSLTANHPNARDGRDRPSWRAQTAAAPSSSGASLSRHPLDEIPTSALVRYLTSMSKLGVRVKAPYYDLLDTLQTRSLTSFESIAVLGVMSRHHLHRPQIIKHVVRSLPELTGSDGAERRAAGGVLHPTQKALLLKYLGQAGAQRFVRAPSSPYFESGAFFTSADELRRLSFLELIFVVYGLTALRQYASPTLAAALEAMREKAAGASGVGVSDATVDDYARVLATVRSATTKAEFLSALVHVGMPLVPVALIVATAHNMHHALLQSRSLFVDMARLADMWPLLPTFLGTVTEQGLGTVSESAPTLLVVEAFAQLQRTAAVLVSARLLDIANPATLRRNSFLIGQLAAGIQLRGRYLPEVASPDRTQPHRPADTFALTSSPAPQTTTRSVLPPDTSEALELLVTHVDLNHLNVVLANPAQLVDCAVLGLFLLTVMDLASPPRLLFKSEALTLLAFVHKHIDALRVKDAVLVWHFVDEMLTNTKDLVPGPGMERTGSTSSSSSVSRAERVQQAWTETGHQELVRLLRDVRAACRATVMEEKALPKLSPVEKRLLDRQLS